MAAISGMQPMRERPELSPFLASTYEAFWELSSCRSSGMGVGPIPWTAIDAFCQSRAITDQDELRSFTQLIRAMDGAYIGYVTEAREKEQREAETRAKGAR